MSTTKKSRIFTKCMRAFSNWYLIKIRKDFASSIADRAFQRETLTHTNSNSDRSMTMLKLKDTKRYQWVEHEIVIYTNTTHIAYAWLLSRVGILIKPVLQLLLLSTVLVQCGKSHTAPLLTNRCTKSVYKLNSFGLRWVLGSQCD